MKFPAAWGIAAALCGSGWFCAAVGQAPLPHIQVPYAQAAPLLAAGQDDPAWPAAVKIPSLSLSPECKAALAPQGTTVQLLWDRQFLYVRFVCQDDDILATLSGRDAEYHREDVVEVFLDPVGDGREYIELQVSPNNGVRDAIYVCSGEPKYDEHGMQLPELVARDVWAFDCWNMEGLKTAASRFKGATGEGWLAELAIPANCLRRLGLKQYQAMTLRANFIRLDRPKDPANPAQRIFVSTNWSPVLAGRPHRSPGADGYVELTAPPATGGH